MPSRREGRNRAFFNDAARAPAGRLVSQVDIAGFVALADELTPPSFAAFLQVAVYEGMRPGELDGLRWDRIDFQAGTTVVDQRWNAKSQEFTLSKHGVMRTIALTDPARERLLSLPHVERPRTRRARHRDPVRPPGRRRAGQEALRAPRCCPCPRARTRGLQAGTARTRSICASRQPFSTKIDEVAARRKPTRRGSRSRRGRDPSSEGIFATFTRPRASSVAL
jgi:integrase